jgi:hypothetical protein
LGAVSAIIAIKGGVRPPQIIANRATIIAANQKLMKKEYKKKEKTAAKKV